MAGINSLEIKFENMRDLTCVHVYVLGGEGAVRMGVRVGGMGRSKLTFKELWN